MSETTEIGELVKVSQFAARDILLVQGGGGNASIKSSDGTRMWIKASGFRLRDVSKRFGYVESDLPALVSLMRHPGLVACPRGPAQDKYVRCIQATTRGAVGLRPSLEIGFHAVLARVVLHTHPVYVNAFACMEGGEAALADRLGQPVVWARYEPPGYTLGAEVDTVAAAFQRTLGRLPSEIVLRNHGLIATGTNGAEVIATTGRLVRAGRAYFGAVPAQARACAAPPRRLAEWAERLEQILRQRFLGRNVVVRGTTRVTLMQAADDPDQWVAAGPLVPGDVVYGGHTVWKADVARPPETWVDKEIGSEPTKMIVVVAGLGVVFVGTSHQMLDAMEETLLAHVLTRQLIARRGLARVLPPVEVKYLLSMESEKYREAVAAGWACSSTRGS